MNGTGSACEHELTLESRAEMVRRYEEPCYQMCYYLLRCETKALKAALASIEALLRDPSFYVQGDRDRLEAVKRTVIRYSLKLAVR